MFYSLFVQFFAILFLIFFTLSYHAKTRRNILLIQLLGVLSLTLHFFLLHAWTGFAVQVVHVFSVILFLFKDKRKFLKSNFVLFSFFVVYFVFTLITWEGYFSFFAFLGISSGTLARWQNKPNSIRTILIFTSIFWIIYDLSVKSYGGIISETVLLISVIISLILNKSVKQRG